MLEIKEKGVNKLQKIMTSPKFNKEEVVNFITSVNWLEIIYLMLFAAFVIEKFLETTVLQWKLPEDYNMVIRVLLCVFILISYISMYVCKGKIEWKEFLFAVIMAAVAYMVSYHVDEIYLFDTMLLIIAAKNVDYKKVCFVYICIAVVLMGLAMYLSGKGYIPDYVYQSERGVRHSLGICYTTEFMAHLFFLFAVYICYREHKLTFFEIILMVVITLEAYRWTYARNSALCILGLCLLCLFIKVLDLFHIRLSDHKWINILSIGIVIAFAIWIYLMINYNGDNAQYAKLNEMLSSRLELSARGYRDYGITPFGSIIQENGLAFGALSINSQYFCLDVYFVRVLIKYGYLFALLISFMYVALFLRMRSLHKDFILIVLFMIVVFGMTDFQLFSIAYNPIWIFLFTKIKRG